MIQGVTGGGTTKKNSFSDWFYVPSAGDLKNGLTTMWDITRDSTLDLIGMGNGNSFGGKSLTDYVNQNNGSTPPPPPPTTDPNKMVLVVLGVVLLASLLRR